MKSRKQTLRQGRIERTREHQKGRCLKRGKGRQGLKTVGQWPSRKHWNRVVRASLGGKAHSPGAFAGRCISRSLKEK